MSRLEDQLSPEGEYGTPSGYPHFINAWTAEHNRDPRDNISTGGWFGLAPLGDQLAGIGADAARLGAAMNPSTYFGDPQPDLLKDAPSFTGDTIQGLKYLLTTPPTESVPAVIGSMGPNTEGGFWNAAALGTGAGGLMKLKRPSPAPTQRPASAPQPPPPDIISLPPASAVTPAMRPAPKGTDISSNVVIKGTKKLYPDTAPIAVMKAKPHRGNNPDLEYHLLRKVGKDGSMGEFRVVDPATGNVGYGTLMLREFDNVAK